MKHTWNQSELDFVSAKKQRSRWYLAIHKPQILAHYSVTSQPVDHPVSAIDTLNISGSQFVDGGHTAWVGTGSGLSDLGKVRVRRPPNEWDGPFMPVMESGSGLIRWNEATHITVVDEYRPWVKHPRYNTATSKWGWDQDYYDAGQLKNYPPQVVMGAPFVGILESGSISGSFVAANTITFDAALIAGSFWSTPDGRNFFYDGTESSPLVIDFVGASPNGNYIKYTAIDTNAASHVGKRLIWTFDKLSDLPRVGFTQISGGKAQGGYVTQIHAYNLNDTEIPPGTEIVIFEAASYGNTACAMGGNSPFRNNVVFRGWTTNEQITKDPLTGMAIITAETINGIMANAPSYDTFYAQTSPVPTASEIIGTYNLSLDRVAFNHMRWRSTVGDICDFYPASGLAMSLHPVYQNLPRASWWEQLRSNYYDRGMLWSVASDSQSNLFSFEDLNITGNSAAYNAFPELNSRHMAGQLSIERTYHEEAAQVKLYAVASTTPYGAESPGNVLGYAGGNVEHAQGLIVDTQDRLITWAGNLRAKRNAEFKRVTLPLAGNMRIEPVPNALIPVTITASANARNLDWDSKLFVANELNITYDVAGGVTTQLVLEEIVNGKGGSAITFPVIKSLPPPDPPDNPPPPGPSVGSDVVYVMGANYLGRTRDFSAPNPVWGTVSIPSVSVCYDFILDPWNPINGGWLSTDQGLYKSTNLNSTVPTWSLVLSQATIEANTSSGFRDAYKIIGSINVQNYFAYFFVAGGDSSQSNVYCAYTSNGGASWGFSLVGVVEANAWGGAADYVPHLVNNNVVLYTTITQFVGSPATTRPMIAKSVNGGVSFSNNGAMGSLTSASVLPYTVHCPYDQNQNGLVVYATNNVGSFKSVDGGATFSDLGIIAQDDVHRHNIETYTQDNQQLFIWDNADNLRLSTNAGISFTTKASVPGTVKAAGGFPFDSSRYYAVSTTGIYVSFDGGNSFQNKTNNYPVSQLSPTASSNRAVIVPVWVS